MLHTARVAAELVRRATDGAWADEPTVVGDGVLTLSSIGFDLNSADLYAQTGLTA